MICAISSNTFDDNSWWVPYEIGYADKEKKECCIIKLNNLRRDQIPEYLKIKQIIYTVSDLNKKLKSWSSDNLMEWTMKNSYFYHGGLLSESATEHVLSGVVNIR